MTDPRSPSSLSRRAFVQATAAVTAGLVLPRGAHAAAPHASPHPAPHPSSADPIRVGVVGC
ncbi:MAG TPA: hypothetical protein VKA84_12345, partial [Gemmatimonadaceae bacterium]|nr:hypothetical protein [Gemmatimonadaceae bacterium]